MTQKMHPFPFSHQFSSELHMKKKQEEKQVNIFNVIFIIALILPGTETATVTTVKDGKLCIRNGILFELLGRPYELSKMTILKQPIDLGPLLDSIKGHQDLSKTLNSVCNSISEPFQRGGEAREFSSTPSSSCTRTGITWLSQASPSTGSISQLSEL